VNEEDRSRRRRRRKVCSELRRRRRRRRRKVYSNGRSERGGPRARASSLKLYSATIIQQHLVRL